MNRDRGYIFDILEAARLAVSYVHGKTFEEFLTDLQCQDAVIRRIEVIGEAARRVSARTREKFPDLPWKEMVQMRNVLIHDYEQVDSRVVWNTVHEDLPPLIQGLEAIP